MGYAFMVGFCAACKKSFTFNPNKVPSVKVDGVKEPVCKTCIEKANKIRTELRGMEPLTYHPDAYNPVDENELNY